MFQMLTCFDIKANCSLADFKQSLDEYTAYMHELDLVESNGPIGLRQSDTIMDTDEERSHSYFVMMYFRDRQQCDNAVDYIRTHKEPGHSSHKEVYSKVENQIFICWQDV